MKKFLLVIFLFSAFAVSAQTMTQEEQAAQIARLTEEVNTLKQKGNTWDKILNAMPKVSGYVMGRYTYDGDASTFRLRRVRVSLTGNLSPKIDYKFQAELSSFKLLDAYFNYKPFDELKIKAGQFKVPFTIENTDFSPTKMILIDYPMVIDRLVGNSEEIGETTLKTTGRELGIDIHGSIGDGILNYDLAVFNGNGLNTTDNNKSKDVVGRLIFSPIENLKISGSYYWGEFDENFYARERYSVGAVYDNQKLIVRAEYIGGKTGFDGYEVDQEGWYALAGYRFCEGKWSVAARYDTFTDDTDIRSLTEQTNYTIGGAWKPAKYFRLQANYVHKDMVGDHRNVVMMQATVSF
ncbi:MAG: porin [Rikenellaceae bacterium]|nr:porin [Rikenellaceae bacterium]